VICDAVSVIAVCSPRSDAEPHDVMLKGFKGVRTSRVTAKVTLLVTGLTVK
jgi:hypothetical protein